MGRSGKRCVIYLRVSTEMQVDGYSLEGQNTSLTSYAKRENMKIVKKYEDAGKSGKSIEGRPEFMNMMTDIRNGLETDYVLVYKLSRFGRNAADILSSMEILKSFGVNLICVEEGIDSSQTSGKLLISVISAVAEIERENIIEQTMNGRKEKARQGLWNGGFAPYGYYIKDKHLYINEDEAEAVRFIFDKFANTSIGMSKIAKTMNLLGIKKYPRHNGRLELWSANTVRHILDNPVYCGKIAFGRRTTQKIKGSRNEYKMVRSDDYILAEGAHEAIISDEIWEKACEKRKRTGHKTVSVTGMDRIHILSGYLKCPKCGGPMYTNKHAWTNKDGTYKEVFYYVCARIKIESGRKCDYLAHLKKSVIEPLVIDEIGSHLNSSRMANEIFRTLSDSDDKTNCDKEITAYNAKLKEVTVNKQRLQNELDNLSLNEKYRDEKIKDMNERLSTFYAVIDDLRNRINDAQMQMNAASSDEISVNDIKTVLRKFNSFFEVINDEEKRKMIDMMISEIYLNTHDESEIPLKSVVFNPFIIKNKGDLDSQEKNEYRKLAEFIGALIRKYNESIFSCKN